MNLLRISYSKFSKDFLLVNLSRMFLVNLSRISYNKFTKKIPKKFTVKNPIIDSKQPTNKVMKKNFLFGFKTNIGLTSLGPVSMLIMI